MHRDRDAILDAEYRAHVNHEIYFFSSLEALQEFRARPLRYVDEVTDPVTLERFIPDAGSPRVDHDGRPYFFAENSTRQRFESDPSRYANPGGAMLQ